MKASHAFDIGDSFQARTGLYLRGQSIWQIRTENHVSSEDLNDHISWLLNKIEPFQLVAKRFVNDPEVDVAIRINLKCPDSIGGISLESDQVKRLAAISNRIDISFFGEEGKNGSNE